MQEECMFCFLTSIKQRNIKKLAQVQEERFENILNRYKEIFIENFSTFKRKGICNNHKKLVKSKYILEYFSAIREEELVYFFEKIILVYKLWISGDAFNAIGVLKNLLVEKELLSEEIDITNKIFFRGRKAEKNIFNCYDMFHIPYDKRYLVLNQRFSLSGYPLLYLNASIEGVISELEISDKTLNDYVFSVFYFNNSSRIYSLENPFKEYFFEEEKEEFFMKENFTYKIMKKKIFKFILASICCFEKRIQHRKQEKLGKNIFYEEYVIPQALTQVLKLYDYAGVYYPSTRINKTENGLFSETTFNLAYFPTYRDKHYDDVLYKSLDITAPISYENICDLKEIDINLKNLLTNMLEKKLDVKKEKKLNHLIEIFINRIEKSKNNIETLEEKSYYIEKILFDNFILKNLLDLSK